MSGNRLYGFIGRSAGFTALELSSGGGVAQYVDHCRDGDAGGALGPGVAANCAIGNPIPASWDETSDQAVVFAGIVLYDRFGTLFSTPYGRQMREKYRALEAVLREFREGIDES